MSGDGQWDKADVLAYLQKVGDPLAGEAPPPEPDAPDFLEHLADSCPLNDAGNAARLLARHGPDLTYVEDVGWYVWDGSHWDGQAGRREVERRAAATAAAFRDEVPLLSEVGMQMVPGESPLEYQKRVWRWASGAGNQGRIKAMMEAAQRSVCRPPAEMDAAPELFACRNVTLELRQRPDADGRLVAPREPARGDLVTHISPVEYDPAADCPRWRAFLEQVQPDPEVRLWLQRYCGYLLSGYTSEQIVLCCEGAGANGKSIFWLAIRHVLGGHAAAIAPASFVRNDHKDGSAPTPDLARLPGKRMGLVSEWKRGQILDEGAMKAWTGGDPITVRKLREDVFEFRPVLKLIFTWNNRPVVRAGDDGTWRRLKVLPWPVNIPEARQIKEHLMLGAFREEAAGILNWMLDGWSLWVERGLQPYPPVISEVTSGFRAQSDTVGLWIREGCILDGDASATASSLYETYSAFTKRDGNEAITQTAFGTALEERGFRKRRGTGGLIYRLGLRPLQLEPDEPVY